MQPFPSFDEQFPFLNQFILELVDAYQVGKLSSWDELDEKVKTFFTPERMTQMESLLPGWQKTASYSDGITVTHVMCVFLGVFMLSEFQALTPEQQQIEKWIVLFHDLDKLHIRGKKDTMHAFRSGALTAKVLPAFGFPVTEKYPALIDAWYELTLSAYHDGDAAPKPDNEKLPKILSGIDQLFGEDSPAALITKTALLHISLDVDPQYATPAPLTEEEIKSYINPTLLPLLKVMMMGDNDGWVLFDPEDREIKYKTTVAAFQEIERMLSRPIFMNSSPILPSFDEHLPSLNQFILELVKDYHAGKINLWDELDKRVKNFFSPERMDEMETLVPGWKKMASYVEGVTLTHVMCVFLGMYMEPAYLRLPREQQEEMKWVILFHDVEKQPQAGKRDHAHAFRSAVGAARTLPRLGFSVTPEYDALIDSWDQFTRSAITKLGNSADDVQDNSKFPTILDGIEQMFGQNTPATLIIKTILFHLSVNMDMWPPPNPLTNAEVKRYFNSELAALLQIMSLGDNDGWTFFDYETRENQRADILDKFEKIEKLLS